MDTFPLKVDVNSLYHLYPVPLPISSSSLVAFSICVTSKFIPGFNLVLVFFSSPITAINPHQNKSGVEPRCDYHPLNTVCVCKSGHPTQQRITGPDIHWSNQQFKVSFSSKFYQ